MNQSCDQNQKLTQTSHQTHFLSTSLENSQGRTHIDPGWSYADLCGWRNKVPWFTSTGGGGAASQQQKERMLAWQKPQRVNSLDMWISVNQAAIYLWTLSKGFNKHRIKLNVLVYLVPAVMEHFKGGFGQLQMCIHVVSFRKDLLMSLGERKWQPATCYLWYPRIYSILISSLLSKVPWFNSTCYYHQSLISK